MKITFHVYTQNSRHEKMDIHLKNVIKYLLYYASHAASVPPFTQTNTFLASLTEEHLQREVTPSIETNILKLVV